MVDPNPDPLTPAPSTQGGEGSKAGAVILCGGRSSRMGRAKAMLPFGNETLLQRAVRIVGPVASTVVVVAAKDQELPPLPADVVILRDALEAQGPLPAVNLGLQALVGRVDIAFVLACDLPFLKVETVGRILNSVEQTEVTAPWSDGYFHPLAAAYRMSVLPKLQEMQASGELSLQRLFDHFSATRVDVDPGELRNLNTPVEYEAALNANEN